MAGRSGKALSLKAPGQDRFARLDTLGGEYSEAALSAVLAGEKAHKPRRENVLQAEPKTVNLLVDIQEKLQAVTERYNLLAGQIKSAEKRMAESAVLRTQIINDSKTRDVYTAYRKAGYSKKFLAEHEADILLHKAAKKAFDELGVQKLPKVKELQSEYAVLLAEKKKAYAEYQQARQEMQELLTDKANVYRLLGTEEQNTEKERKRNYCKR